MWVTLKIESVLVTVRAQVHLRDLALTVRLDTGQRSVAVSTLPLRLILQMIPAPLLALVQDGERRESIGNTDLVPEVTGRDQGVPDDADVTVTIHGQSLVADRISVAIPKIAEVGLLGNLSLRRSKPVGLLLPRV